MSIFKREFQQFLRSPVSLESVEMLPPEDEPVAEGTLRDHEIEEIRAAQADTHSDLNAACSGSDDAQYLQSSAAAVGSVSEVVQAAQAVQPAHGEAFVSTANTVIAQAEKVLDVEIPRLENAPDASVDSASMESLTGWIGDTAKAFGSATKSFFQRIGLGFARLSSSVKGMQGRLSKIMTKEHARKGDGGKPISVGTGYLIHLVKGDGLSHNLAADAQEYIQFARGFITIASEYHNRIDDFTRKALFDAIANRNNVGRSFLNIGVDDLREKAAKLADSQPKHLLGNVRFALDKHSIGSPIAFRPQPVPPFAKDLVRNNNRPNSLSKAEVKALHADVLKLLVEELASVESISEHIERSVGNVTTAVARLRSPLDERYDTDGSVEVLSNIDNSQILRIENELVSELGNISEYITELHVEIANVLSALIVLIEESVIQD